MDKPTYRPETFSTEDNLGYLLKTCHSLLHDCAILHFNADNISFTQWLMLYKLREKMVITCSDMARQLRHDNGALTRSLDHLEKLGYLERQRSQKDRRVVELNLTKNGEKVVSELTPRVIELYNIVLSEFSQAEFSELLRLLKKLKSRLSDLSVKN